MSPLIRNAVQWLLAAVLVLGFAWATGTKVFAPRPWAGSTPPDVVLDSPVVVPPNYTNFGFTPRELLALLAKRGFTVRWERQGSERFVLRVGGENQLTVRPLDLALQLRPVAGPEAVVSQVVGFTGPAVIVEGISQDGEAAHGAETTNLIESFQTALVQEPGTRLNALVQAHRAAAAARAAERRQAPTSTDRPVMLTPSVPPLTPEAAR